MSLVPIKLLKNIPVRNKLLKIKGETHELDKNDYIESRINVNRKAKNLLAIEDGSEIAKYYLHKKGLFEQIARDIKKEAKQKFGFLFRKTSAMEKRPIATKGRVGTDYILMEHSYEDGSGHYGMTRVNHDNKTAKIFDSMRNTESDFEEFKQGWLNCYIECDNKPFTFIFDTTNMGMVSALYAYKMSYFIKEIKALNNKLLEKSIIIVNNKYIHGLLHMIFLIEKPIAPVYIIDDLNYADILYERLGFGSCFYDSTKATLIEP